MPLYQENEIIYNIIIPGRPATKKTHNRIIYIKKIPRLIPSPQFVKYEKSCLKILKDIKDKDPINFGIAVELNIWLDNWRVGDHVGYLQSIGDILEKAKIIENDKWIFWKNKNHWLKGVDKENPRVEIIISKCTHPIEEKEKFIK